MAIGYFTICPHFLVRFLHALYIYVSQYEAEPVGLGAGIFWVGRSQNLKAAPKEQWWMYFVYGLSAQRFFDQ